MIDCEKPSVITIILNWNRAQDTIQAAQSVMAMQYENNQLLIVDNNSRPESVTAIKNALGKNIEIVQTGENLGYAGGNNFGINLAMKRGAEYCLILNNDITVDSQMLQELVSTAQAIAKVAILGPWVYRENDRDKLFYIGWEIDWRRWLFFRQEQKRCQQGIDDVDFVQGCAMMIRCSFIKQHGMFDANYHLYCEDADLAVRAQRAGLRTIEVKQASCWHKGYGSSGQHSALKTYYGLRNRLYFITKLAPASNRWRLRAQLLIFDTGGRFLQCLSAIVRGGKQGHQAAGNLRALFCAIRDALLNRMGPGPSWLLKDYLQQDDK